MWLSLARSPAAHCGMRCSGTGLARGLVPAPVLAPVPAPVLAPVTCHSVQETPTTLCAFAWAQVA